MDLARECALTGRMDDAEDLIERLLALAGMWLEDASAIALVAGDMTYSERLTTLGAATSDVQTVVAAAEVVYRTGIGSLDGLRGPK